MPAPIPDNDVAVVGGGPAGLMAAEAALAEARQVDLYDSQGSVGRKFLLAGKGGLNLTHSEPFEPFVARFGAGADWVRGWLEQFDNDAIRRWARGLGIETVVGSSRRVFPADLKAAPLLRAWLRRLRASGLRLHVHHRLTGFGATGELRFATPAGPSRVTARATVLALGGASWPQLGSDGGWWPWLQSAGVNLAPLQSANCGFDVDWSARLVERHAGAALKSVRLKTRSAEGVEHAVQSEAVITATGIEGSGVYALSAILREAIARAGSTTLWLDLLPGHSVTETQQALAAPRGARSFSEHLRRRLGLQGVKTALVYECLPRAVLDDPQRLAGALHALPLTLRRPRPVAEAISTAGGVRAASLDESLMLRAVAGVFCAGEMLDWEAPTGGYLLSACLASGRVAGAGAAAWAARSGDEAA